ncbi:MAG: MucR family transcriptional regulator [Hyphomicrobiaceae bacterium]|nr:MucR family transcriptional regulator [Hyphomicrobiaceae bacterium]
MSEAAKLDLVKLTAEIVAAYVSHNIIATSEIPQLLSQVHAALNGLGGNSPAPEIVRDEPKPAIAVKKSITPDYLICLEDGKKFKSLKRHLRSHYNLSPEQYREKWALPHDYPMVAPRYAEARSQLAKKMGLGTRRAEK